MFDTSIDLLWGGLALAIVVLAGFLSYLLYSVTKVVQESRKTVEDVNKKLAKIDPIVDSTSTTVSSLMQTIDGINNGILKPIESFSQVFKGIRSAAKVFTSKEK